MAIAKLFGKKTREKMMRKIKIKMIQEKNLLHLEKMNPKKSRE